MSTLFLIGNGFDLSCGMKTRYADVYNSYCKLQDSDSEVIKQFKQDISSSYENWSDFEEGMAEYAKTLDSEEVFVECIKDFRNFLQKYLKQEENKFNEYVVANEELQPLLIKEMRKSLSEYYIGITPRVTKIVNNINKRYGNRIDCISFNYTSVFDNMMSMAFDTDNTFHIHCRCRC